MKKVGTSRQNTGKTHDTGEKWRNFVGSTMPDTIQHEREDDCFLLYEHDIMNEICGEAEIGLQNEEKERVREGSERNSRTDCRICDDCHRNCEG